MTTPIWERLGEFARKYAREDIELARELIDIAKAVKAIESGPQATLAALLEAKADIEDALCDLPDIDYEANLQAALDAVSEADKRYQKSMTKCREMADKIVVLEEGVEALQAAMREAEEEVVRLREQLAEAKEYAASGVAKAKGEAEDAYSAKLKDAEDEIANLQAQLLDKQREVDAAVVARADAEARLDEKKARAAARAAEGTDPGKVPKVKKTPPLARRRHKE